MILIVMGVTGAGKTTLGRALAAALGCCFIDADDHHPPANIAKMRRGEPLTDADREPWLARLHALLRGRAAAGEDTVLACSALKPQYRATLAAGLDDFHWAALTGDAEVLRQRVAGRRGHFMPPALLESQLAALRMPLDAIPVPITEPTERQAAQVLAALRRRRAATTEAESDGANPMKHYRTEIIADGLAFPEGPRWHAGRFWFTDQHDHRVLAMDEGGGLTTIAITEDRPGGLGWLPNGVLLCVLMTTRQIVRIADGERLPYADLSRHAPWHCNDMVVDASGRVYAGNFGYDVDGGAAQTPTALLLADTDGGIEPFADGLIFPNGSAITPDGRTLLVSETFANRVSWFGLGPDGRMTDRGIWAELGDVTPDGLCLDAEGALWIASPGSHETLRVARGGEVLARCESTGTPYACMLGGPDRRRLYVCTAETCDPEQAARLRSGRIETVEVEVGGAGLP
jgi:carbohydrate kinase (thermoresistant glucokinase family)